MPVIYCNCFCLPTKHTWPPLWNRFSISKCQAVPPKAFPSFWAYKDSLLGSWEKILIEGSLLLQWRSNQEKQFRTIASDVMREAPLKTWDVHREANSQTALLNRWGRVHDEPAQQKSSAFAPDTGGTLQQPVHLSGRGREVSTDDWTVIRRGELSR